MAITQVQFKDSPGATAATLAFPSNNTAGNLLVLAARKSINSQPTDTAGNTWLLAKTQPTMDIWYVPNCLGGANTVQAQNSNEFIIAEFSGMPISGGLTQTNGASGSGTVYAAGSVLTTSSNALIIGGVCNESADGIFDTPSGGFTEIGSGNGNAFMAKMIVSSIGTYSYGGTLSTTVSWNAAVAVFIGASQPVAAGGGGWLNTHRDFVNKRGIYQ